MPIQASSLLIEPYAGRLKPLAYRNCYTELYRNNVLGRGCNNFGILQSSPFTFTEPTIKRFKMFIYYVYQFMNEEAILKATALEKQYNELQENLHLVNNQISELEQFKESLEFLIKSEKKEILSSLGKGVYIKTTLEDRNELFVGVGTNVIVKKTPEETLKLVGNQITKLKEASTQISFQLENYARQLQDLINSMQKSNSWR